ncbi:hypothetical protein AB5N19_01477 [Seiridium cardinale]|uniref:Tyrosinase copper-binding domain-containing protein n=1 Tax=Seiridium cardinale TaxID=138064 RepID=A0ABR2XPU5_9PEZI
MKFSTAVYALAGATAVSARPGTCKKRHDPLPLQSFGNFTLISVDDAKAGYLKSHNGTKHKIEGYPASGYPTSGYTYTMKPAYTSAHGSASSEYASSPTSTSASSGDSSAPSSTSSSYSGSSLSASSSAFSVSSTASSLSASETQSASQTLSVSQSLSTTSSSTSSAPAVTSSAAATCGERVEWNSYPDADRHAFAAAFKCLIDAKPSGTFSQSKNRYEDIVRVHQMMVNSVHGNGIFLFWHRYYVWTLEQIMKDECGFQGSFPWWDETLVAGKFAESSIFTAEFFGSLPQPSGDKGTCITDGYFANTVCHIGPGSDFQTHCLSRAVNETLTMSVTLDFVTTCNLRTTYSDMENCAEYGPHGYGHNGIGSIMADVSASPSDPSFFLHHLFVDRNFWLWQELDASRKVSTDSVSLDTVISVQGLRPDVTVADVINTEKGKLCYSYSY